MIITQKMIHNAGGTEEDVDGFVEFIRMIEGVEISFMILETSDGSHRISLRSSGNYSVNDVANYFDGGGHKFAAGARIPNMITADIEKAIRDKCPDLKLAEIEGEYTVDLFKMLRDLIDNNRAKRKVFVLDTLKKFVNVMDKKACTEFGKIAREYLQDNCSPNPNRI